MSSIDMEGLLAPSDPAKDHWSNPNRSFREQDIDGKSLTILVKLLGLFKV